MNKSITAIHAAVFFILATIAGCTVHPRGESVERQAALDVGKIYEKPLEKRDIPSLPAHPTPNDLVRYAFLTNAELEQQYWQWRAAIEQITIDGTQPTSLALSFSTTLNEGEFSAGRTIATAGNDPMTDISFPGKLSAAAQRSLENARAAGWRFRKTQFELRRKVLDAYYDYAANAEMIRLAEENIQLLQTTATVTDARNRSGSGGQQDILKARNEVDLAQNDIENMKSQLPIQRAAINALLNRPVTAEIPIPNSLPSSPALTLSNKEILDLAAKSNPELIALADEICARHEDIHLAKLQYYPDFDVAASTDLKGITQTFFGEFTLPIFRYEALAAAVAQARADLHAAEAMRRQASHDLAARLVDDIATMRDADRQIDLLGNIILPRTRDAVSLQRTTYQTGSASLLDLLDSQRALIGIERLLVDLNITRNKRLAEIESISRALPRQS
ncbi:MAG TPA: TolC family protein [Tepidisphaeraceae bacterium]|jgi:outer membrane protein TolC